MYFHVYWKYVILISIYFFYTSETAEMLNTFSVFYILFSDTSRHYLPVNVIKQVIESMSYAKLVRSVFNYSSLLRIYSEYSYFLLGTSLNTVFLISLLVECFALAYHWWTVISSGSSVISWFVERLILKMGALHSWGCFWNCQVRVFFLKFNLIVVFFG